MELRELQLAQYRNIKEATLPLDARFTVIWGENGAGKTNLIEAIYLVSTFRSFRTSDQRVLLKAGHTEALARLKAFDSSLGLASTFEVRIAQNERSTRKSGSIDGKRIAAAKDFYGRVRAILFTPEDLGMLRGSPSGRRQFLDRVIFAQERTHIGDIQDYEKTVRSRNKVLKSEGTMGRPQQQALLDSYDEGVASLGARIWRRRASVVEAIRPGFLRAFEEIHGPGLEPALEYASGVETKDPLPEQDEVQRSYLEQLQGKRGQDRARGATSVGPHRDDLRFTVFDSPAADFASQGQARALVLAFKIAELRLTRTRIGYAPVLLLDDVSSELDPSRNAKLFDMLWADAGQCVLTTTSPDFIRLAPGASHRSVQVVHGTLRA